MLASRLWSARFYDAVPTLHAQGDAVCSPDGRTATLAVYSESYRRSRLPWPLSGDATADHREVLDLFTLDVATSSARRIASRTTNRRLFRGFGVQFEHRDGPLYDVVVGGHGPYGTLRRVSEGDVPRRQLLVRVDTHSGDMEELDEAAYAHATARAESLRHWRLGRLVWNVEAARWVDKWGPFRRIGDRHVRSLRDPASGQTIGDLVLQFVYEDPTQWDRTADPVEIGRIAGWPGHRR